MDAIETIKYKGFDIEIYQDENAESPRDWDNVGTMFCEHRSYQLGDKGADNPFTEDEETGKYKLRDDIAVALPLYLLDHSGLAMRTHGFSDVDPGEWDSGQVGVIYATKDKVKGGWSFEKELEYMISEAKSAVEHELSTAKDSDSIQAL